MQKIDETWQEVLKILQNEVTAVSFDLWIKALEPFDVIDRVLYLSITSETAKNRVLKLHKEQIEEALQQVSTEITDFKIMTTDEKDVFEKENKNKEVEEKSPRSITNFNAKYTFDSFVVGNSNKFVYAAARGVAENPFSKINPLFIYGGVGLGKTHLLHAIGNYITEHNPELKVMYVTCEKFTYDYVEGLKNSKDRANSSFREKYRNLDVLIVDDIQFISKATATQEEFFHTFNDLYQNNKQIIIASDRPPREIATLEERLKSRFSMGLVQDIQTPDYETRLAILQKKAQQEHYVVDDEVLTYIAENCDTNIREMEGILSKVHFYANLLGKESASMDEVRESLKDQVRVNKQDLTPERIIDCVCQYYSIDKSDLIGKKKNKEIVEPRQICIYLICEMLDLPLSSIGQVFGGRDHTTVIHSREKVTTLLKNNARYKTIINDLKSMAKRT